jgi:hypothetical protein
MKPFNINNLFEDHHGFIPWSHPDIRQTFWTKEDTRWDSESRASVRSLYTLSTIWYKDTRILQFYTNDDNNYGRKLTIYNYYKDDAYGKGLVVVPHYHINASTLLDALHYKVNAPVYFNKNGTLKKGFFGMLRRRLRSPTLKASWVTQHMLDAAIEYITPRLIENQSIYDVLDINNINTSVYFQDAVTQTYHVDCLGQNVRTGNGWIRVSRNTLLNLPNLGYRFDATNDIWLTHNQVYYDGNVYDRSEINVVTCTDCGTETVDQMTHEGKCQRCLGDGFKIHNYSTRVEGLLKFKATKVKPSTIYLGCELEYETNNRNKAQFAVGKLLHGHALMKSDGSIRNGFEIVTCPATLDIHLDVFKNFYANMPTDLKTEKNVGMHVHISRKPLSQLTIGKITEFLNRQDNKEFIHHIAGRINNSYARMDSGRSITYPWKHRNGGDRYNALNLNNPNTIEVRLFATPMDYKTFAMRLQFCQALVDYCGPASTSLPLKQQTTYPAFIGWLKSGNSKIYPELSNHLKGFN